MSALYELEQAFKDLVVNCILSNTDVRMEANDEDMVYYPEGSALECGMINFLLGNDIDVQHEMIQRNVK